MHVSTRSYLTAGIAALSVGAMSFAPIQPLSQAPAVTPELTKAVVQLAAAIDPITPVINTLISTGTNFANLVDTWGALPLPVLQQRLTNVGTFFGELPDLSLIIGQIAANVGNALRAPYAFPTQCAEDICDVINPAPFNPPLLPPPFTPYGPPNRQAVWGLLPFVVGDQWPTLEPIFDALVTPISGLAIGLIGPVLAPVLSLANSVTAALDAFKNSDVLGAINQLINIPTNMINAFFNGGPVLDLTPVLKSLLPASVSSIGLTMGGLFSPGGVAFDAFNATAALEGLGTLTIPGLPVGPIGSIYTINQAIAKAIVVTPPSAGASRVAANAVAAEETAPEETPAVDAPVLATVALDAPAAGDSAPAPKRAATRHGGEAKSSSTGKAAAARPASRARAAASSAK